MKKYPLILLALFTLAGCGLINPISSSESPSIESQSSSTSHSHSESESTSASSSSEEEIIEDDTNRSIIQNGVTLHAWNWTMNNIINRLDEIKQAGYTTIQLSPMQVQKDYYNGGNYKDQWWKLYQPLAFKIASNNNDNVLGTKTDLQRLCNLAKQKDLKIIVDVVSNHLAGGGRNSLNGNVSGYESIIYSNNLIHQTNKWAKDNDTESIVRGNIGDYPDLKTESETVQNRVLSLLKEYIDVGVDGFRFDAAKHIETDEDGQYASNYWKNVLGGATSYAKSKGKDEPYYYGEILNTCGDSRSFSAYTKYMSVIDNKQGNKILTAVVCNKLDDINDSYNSGVSPSNLMLWAESHDTYANDEHETTYISVENINKTYMIQASRRGASSLYFARPYDNTIFGEVGLTNYKDNNIVAINKFHNIFKTQSESFQNQNGCFVNVRGHQGVAIVGVSNNSSTVSLTLRGIDNGTYTDLISKQTFTINNGNLSAKLTNNACILVSNDMEIGTPEISVNPTSGVFNNNFSVQVSVTGAKTSSYQINNGNEINFTNSTSINLSQYTGKITLKVKATGGETVTKTYTYYQSQYADNDVIFYNVPSSELNYSWFIWGWGKTEGSWYVCNKDSVIAINVSGETKCCLVKAPSGTTLSQMTWDKKLAQTDDLNTSTKLYDYEELTWK